MTRFPSSSSLCFPEGRTVPTRLGMALGAATLALLVACSGLQPLPTQTGIAARGSWLSLQGVKKAEVSPGVQVELPDAPYRARFADRHGTYYQASQPVVFRTVHGLATAVEGGLFVRSDQPGVAVVWTEPLWRSATLAHRQTFEVRHFTPATNGSVR